MNRLLSTMRLVRATNLLAIAIFQIMLRYCVVLPLLSAYGTEPALTTAQFALLVAAVCAIAASGNVINDYFDIPTDHINRPQRQVVGIYIDRRGALLMHVLLTLGGIFCGMALAVVFRKETYALLFVGVPIALWFYSTTFKKQMLVGNIVVSLLVALTAYLVVSVEFAALCRSVGPQIVDSPACTDAWNYTTAYALFAMVSNLAREIIKDMEDLRGDTATGCHTLPIEMGMRYSKAIVVVLQTLLAAMIWACYTLSDCLQRSTAVLAVCIALTALTAACATSVVRGTQSADYHRASLLSKAAMMAGILSMLVIDVARQNIQ